MLFAALLALTSCGSGKNIAYFQNKMVDNPEAVDRHAGIVIEPKDMLSIVVSGRDPEIVQPPRRDISGRIGDRYECQPESDRLCG